MNKITFKTIYAPFVLAKIWRKGYFDFNSLIKSPANVYQGDLAKQDDEDFKTNWSTWNRANWGTKWNSYDCEIKLGLRETSIIFQTAWSVPYPIITAFANVFRMNFTHKYVCEYGEFWGIEKWSTIDRFDKKNTICRRIEKVRDTPELMKPLLLELRNYDPDKEEDAIPEITS
jgi:hypothetical protein